MKTSLLCFFFRAFISFSSALVFVFSSRNDFIHTSHQKYKVFLDFFKILSAFEKY